ncbi:hypothetical protein WQ57_12690 [Mesobacillus campisalis]|uniref:ABC transporter periplasmic binding protein yphF n=1 Tax=Mesobacillus campisalis TaxID=1408103 RepID=A0A0M2STX7_9BACI|nr:hypothetical protein [Mesobacillus campisalis]KKK37588.1 hypothetical protein WQ57_12690 [Mesobacillus campisalis]
MNKLVNMLPVIILVSLLSGCMYPAENLAKNQIPYEDQIASVQSAVENFQADNGGILPIKTKDAETPIYQKYLVDFQKVVPRYLPEVPGNAFENGGIFQYVLIDVETEPKVKLFDLRMAETIRDIKLRIRMQEYPPFKEQISGEVFSLDYKELGFSEEPAAQSPFTGQNLPYVITGDGEIYVDYRSDLYQLLKKGYEVEDGEDIRHILSDNSNFVPAYSLPYTIDPSSGEPIFLEK